jgi:dTDP-4-amino-4,6-dideoxygalactose transaminase
VTATSIPFIKPKFPEPEELARDLKRIHENNYYSNNGPVYQEFKKELETYLGQNIKAVVVSNATLGLMIAIQACIKSINPNKKYIAVPSFTFAAGPLAIKWCGYEPVFFDIDANSTQPSVESFQALLEKYSDDLAGVLLINNFGIGIENIDHWRALLRDKNTPFIIDSAPGFGSTYPNGKLLGGEGACEVFSFHATKPFGIGEGGLITTKDPELAETFESLKNFGFDGNKRTVGPGINAKITELDCAIGLRILADYPGTLASRRKTHGLFEAKLSQEEIAFLPKASTAAIQFATILVNPKKRQQILDALKTAGVEARTYYAPAVHTFPYFEQSSRVNLPNTEMISDSVISLPVHSSMEESAVNYICDVISESLRRL